MTTTRTDDPKTSTTILVGIVGVILVFAIVVVLQALYYHAQETEAARKDAGRSPDAPAAVLDQQEAELHSYGWTDKEKGVARIPIDVAMDLVVRESQASTSRPAPKAQVKR